MQLLELVSTEAARMYLEGQGAYARRLSNMTRVKLQQEHADAQADRGLITIAGGPRTRDELIGSCLELRYPVARTNMVIHVLYHDVAGWTACQYCHPHDDHRCECGIGS